MTQSQEALREVSFNGKVYKTDGKSLWIDGVLHNLKMPDEVKSIKEVKVLEVDGRLYHNNEWFSPISLTTKIRREAYDKGYYVGQKNMVIAIEKISSLSKEELNLLQDALSNPPIE